MHSKNTLLLLLLLLVSTLSHSQTNVSGGIYSNTTWNLAGSPYIVTGDIVVFPGKTLTIEPGVEVRVQGTGYPFGNGYSIEVRGNIVAEGTPTAKIAFKADGLATDPWSWAGIYVKTSQGGTASFAYIDISNAHQGFGSDQYGVQPGMVTLEDCNFTHNYIATNPWFTTTFRNCTFTGNGICIQPLGNYDIGVNLRNCAFDSNEVVLTYVYDTVTIDSCNFVHNLNPLQSFLAGTVHNSLFDGNDVAFNGYGGEMDGCEFINNRVAIANLTSGTVTNCVLRNNQLGVELSSGAVVMNNEISNNLVGVKIYDNVAGFTGNRICGNTQYNVENGSDRNIGLVGNCFCESDSTVAEQLLFDGYDDITKGLFNYALYDSTCTSIVQLVSKVTITGEDEHILEGIAAYPNPVRDVLHVRLGESRGSASMRIVNLQGQVMLSAMLQPENTIDISGLPRGVYLFVLEGDRRFVRTLVKE